ncbi:MAG: hypothetical protein ACRCTP_04055 [Aeromonas popoffii]|uniref:hypothetical protein n=1 Tax=Aeromonas popoffii TaxID=70856 RepID=UPI003F38A851
MNYMSQLTIHYGPNSKGIIPYRLITSLAFLDGAAEIVYSGKVVKFNCNSEIFEGIRSLYAQWCEEVATQVNQGALLPGIEQQLNKEIASLLETGMASIIKNLDDIVMQVGGKAQVLSDLADKYTKLFEVHGDNN